MPELRHTLAIDIGGSGLKSMVLDEHGEPCSERVRVPTPRPAVPEAILSILVSQAEAHPAFHRVSVGFPGVVTDNIVHTAPNLDPSWRGVNLGARLTEALGVPVRVANDADVAGLGMIEGRGVELALTLGTGMGASLFVDGILVPNLELGHHPFEQGQTYEERLGDVPRKDIGNKRWSKRLLRAIAVMERVFNYRLLHLGGGNAKKITVALPDNVRLCANRAGLLGGIALWRDDRRP